jgi:hypothetical protein
MGTDRAFAPAPATVWSTCSMLPNGAEAVVLSSSTRPSQILAKTLKDMVSCIRRSALGVNVSIANGEDDSAA